MVSNCSFSAELGAFGLTIVLCCDVTLRYAHAMNIPATPCMSMLHGMQLSESIQPNVSPLR